MRNYYMQFEEQTTQSLMETKLRAFDGGAAAAYQMQVSQVLQQQMGRVTAGGGQPGGAMRDVCLPCVECSASFSVSTSEVPKFDKSVLSLFV